MKRSNQFKLMCDSLNLPIRKVAEQILFIPLPTAKGYAFKETSVAPLEIINKLSETFAIVEEAAKTYEKYPEKLNMSRVKPVLHNAVRRRIIEKQAVRAHIKKQKQSTD